MFGFFRKDKDKKKSGQPSNVQEPEYTCLFCRQKFKASEILFTNTLSNPDPEYNDAVFEQSFNKYQQKHERDRDGKLHGLTAVSRRILDKDRWTVLKSEENGLPLMVKGPFVKSGNKARNTGDGLGFNEGGLAGGGRPDDEEDFEVTSEERLCPRCHFTLPKGFATDKVIQVGLLGGMRTGKTTYMAVVTEYLRRKMGSLNSGLELARVELLPECLKYQEALYLHQQGAKGPLSTPIVGDITDQMVMPIILRLIPINQDYPPFFLILQDIPGEYLKPENKKYLLNSNIPKSNELILLVDINHFIKTIQQQDGEKEFGEGCPQDVNELFSNIDSLGSVIPEGQLNSVQCTLTKLDFWMDEEKDRLDGAVFTVNCDDEHKGAINDERLALVHQQIQALLDGIGGKDQSGLLDTLIDSLHLKESGVHCGFTAVASRIVPNHEEQLRKDGADYQASLNVLEPLMNIFEWNHVLPVNKK